jgi:hypothetical protein
MKWSIDSLKRDANSGVVLIAYWKVTNITSSGVNELSGSIELTPKLPSDPTFVLFEDISEELAIEWVKLTLGNDKVNAIENAVRLNVTDQKDTFAFGVPWSS